MATINLTSLSSIAGTSLSLSPLLHRSMEPRSDGGGGIDAMQIDGADLTTTTATVLKKRKKKDEVDDDNGGGDNDNDSDVMKRVAEIVLVLSAMGRMRGGREPSSAEKKMMAEAKAKAVALCQDLAPKDVVPVDAFGPVINDLGLSRLRENGGAFRAPKLSISDKIALSKRRMEESKAFAAQPTSFPSQRVQNANGNTVENRETPPPVRVPPSDKVGHVTHVPVSTGAFQPPTPAVNVSSAASKPMQFHPPGFDARPAVHPPVLLNNIGRESNSATTPRLDRSHIRPEGRPEGRPNGPSVSHAPASSAASQHMSRTAPVHLRPQAPTQANVGTKNMAPAQLPVRSGSNASGSNAPQVASQPAVAQMPGLAANQKVTGALPNMHHPVQGMQFVHAPVVNHHFEVSRLVQKLLTPKLSPHTAWTPPSREYMNRAMPCQFCKHIIYEVENMVVCDACEKGFHLACLQSHNTKSIRGEWHCPRCLTMTHGKPFPPKYGRVTRNNSPKVLSNPTGVQFQSDKKVGIVNEKVSQPNATIDRIQNYKTDSQVNPPTATTNGRQNLKTQSQAAKVIGSSSESILRHGSETGRNDIPAVKKEDRPKSENCPSNATVVAEASSSISNKPASDKPLLQVKTEVSSQDRLIPDVEPRTAAISQANNKPTDLMTSSNGDDVKQKVLLDGAVIPASQHIDSNGVIESHQRKDNEKDEKDDVHKSQMEIERAHDLAKELAEPSESGLNDVDWIGGADKVVDEKKFFRSCRINGVVYQVQDYSLVRSRSGKLIPLKLQAMWEDSQNSSKWLVVHKCYFPDDLPGEVGRPGAPQNNEVYESTHDSKVLAGFVHGPCEVLPFRKFGEESEKGDQGSLANKERQPVFIRNWFYDETRRAFCPSAS